MRERLSHVLREREGGRERESYDEREFIVLSYLINCLVLQIDNRIVFAPEKAASK